MNRYLTTCASCSRVTSLAYARAHGGACKRCIEQHVEPERPLSRASRNELILEHGYLAYAMEEGHFDSGDR